MRTANALATRNTKQNANRREVAYPAPGLPADDADDAARAIGDSDAFTKKTNNETLLKLRTKEE